jgi:hypothetical protein
MLRIIAAAILVSALSGCVTSEGPYTRSNISSVERPRTEQAQTARAPRRQTIQVSLHQRAYGPLVRRADYPIILGAAF